MFEIIKYILKNNVNCNFLTLIFHLVNVCKIAKYILSCAANYGFKSFSTYILLWLVHNGYQMDFLGLVSHQLSVVRRLRLICSFMVKRRQVFCGNGWSGFFDGLRV